MTAEEEAKYLWGLAVVKDKNGKWRHSDFPVCRDAWPKFFNEWKRARTLKTVDGKPVTVQLVEQYYYAEARERKARRAGGAFVPFPVGIKVHTGEQRWNNGLDVGREEEMEESRLILCKCGEPTHGPKFTECQTCMSFENGKLKYYLGMRVDSSGMNVPCYSASPVQQLRIFYAGHKEIKNYTREQSVKFMKDRLRLAASKPVILHDCHVKKYIIVKHGLA